MDKWIEVINRLIDEKKRTEGWAGRITLAEKLGVSGGLISHYLSGRKQPSFKKFKKMAEVFNIPLSDLVQGAKDLSEASENAYTNKGNGSHEINVSGRTIPLLDWRLAMYGIEAIDKAPAIIKYIIFPTAVGSDKTYALIIKGDAMHSTTPTIKSLIEGDIIAVDPLTKPVHGKTVIASTKGSIEAICRKYIVEGGIAYLKPHNPQYPIIQIDQDVKILATVIARIEFDV